jgi:hypothetical protein
MAKKRKARSTRAPVRSSRKSSTGRRPDARRKAAGSGKRKSYAKSAGKRSDAQTVKISLVNTDAIDTRDRYQAFSRAGRARL